jgi:hypothetical protein
MRPSMAQARAALGNYRETSASKRIATGKTFVSILLLAAVSLFETRKEIAP